MGGSIDLCFPRGLHWAVQIGLEREASGGRYKGTRSTRTAVTNVVFYSHG